MNNTDRSDWSQAMAWESWYNLLGHAQAHTIDMEAWGGMYPCIYKLWVAPHRKAPPGIVIKLIKHLTCFGFGAGCGLMWRMLALANADADAAGLYLSDAWTCTQTHVSGRYVLRTCGPRRDWTTWWDNHTPKCFVLHFESLSVEVVEWVLELEPKVQQVLSSQSLDKDREPFVFKSHFRLFHTLQRSASGKQDPKYPKDAMKLQKC